jgi:16S rRNA (guanine527-N7)-methyltransferase
MVKYQLMIDFKTYFPQLTDPQVAQLLQLQPLYADWNSKINVVSRQDIENLNERHVLHSLCIAKSFEFNPGAKVLDLGTGGGFPGIPLAIMFPEVNFVLVDSIGKKIKVVEEVVSALGLTNVRGIHTRAENLKMSGQFDFVVTRAVAPLSQLMAWCQFLIKQKHAHAYPNGLIALKGGDIADEVKALPGKSNKYVEVMPIRDFLNLEFFAEKYVVYVQG